MCHSLLNYRFLKVRENSQIIIKFQKLNFSIKYLKHLKCKNLPPQSEPLLLKPRRTRTWIGIWSSNTRGPPSSRESLKWPSNTTKKFTSASTTKRTTTFFSTRQTLTNLVWAMFYSLLKRARSRASRTSLPSRASRPSATSSVKPPEASSPTRGSARPPLTPKRQHLLPVSLKPKTLHQPPSLSLTSAKNQLRDSR